MDTWSVRGDTVSQTNVLSFARINVVYLPELGGDLPPDPLIPVSVVRLYVYPTHNWPPSSGSEPPTSFRCPFRMQPRHLRRSLPLLIVLSSPPSPDGHLRTPPLVGLRSLINISVCSTTSSDYPSMMHLLRSIPFTHAICLIPLFLNKYTCRRCYVFRM